MAAGKLPEVSNREEIRSLEFEVRYWMEQGRDQKHAYKWEDWRHGAESLRNASDKADELSRKLREAVGAAENYRRNRLAFVVGALGAAFGVIGVAIALVL